MCLWGAVFQALRHADGVVNRALERLIEGLIRGTTLQLVSDVCAGATLGAQAFMAVRAKRNGVSASLFGGTLVAAMLSSSTSMAIGVSNPGIVRQSLHILPCIAPLAMAMVGGGLPATLATEVLLIYTIRAAACARRIIRRLGSEAALRARLEREEWWAGIVRRWHLGEDADLAPGTPTRMSQDQV